MPSFKKVGGKKGVGVAKKTMSNAKKVNKKKANKKGTRKLSWIEACKKMGYMKKGSDFKPIPKSGSPEHSKIKALMG